MRTLAFGFPMRICCIFLISKCGRVWDLDSGQCMTLVQIRCLKLQVSCCKRAINYRARLKKITYKDKAPYAWLGFKTMPLAQRDGDIRRVMSYSCRFNMYDHIIFMYVQYVWTRCAMATSDGQYYNHVYSICMIISYSYIFNMYDHIIFMWIEYVWSYHTNVISICMNALRDGNIRQTISYSCIFISCVSLYREGNTHIHTHTHTHTHTSLTGGKSHKSKHFSPAYPWANIQIFCIGIQYVW